LIKSAISALDTGVATLSKSFEESVYAHKSTMTWSEFNLNVLTKTGDTHVFPVKPIMSVTKVVDRLHHDKVAPIVIANIDMVEGQLVDVLQTQAQSAFKGDRYPVNFAGLPSVRRTLQSILKTSSEGREAFKEKETKKGMAFANMFHDALMSSSYADYLCLHAVILETLINDVKLVDSKTDSQLFKNGIRQYFAIRMIPDTTKDQTKVP